MVLHCEFHGEKKKREKKGGGVLSQHNCWICCNMTWYCCSCWHCWTFYNQIDVQWKFQLLCWSRHQAQTLSDCLLMLYLFYCWTLCYQTCYGCSWDTCWCMQYSPDKSTHLGEGGKWSTYPRIYLLKVWICQPFQIEGWLPYGKVNFFYSRLTNSVTVDAMYFIWITV